MTNFAAFILLAFWIYLCMPIFGNLWLDEYVSLNIINSATLFSDSIRYQAQSPFYFYVLRFFVNSLSFLSLPEYQIGWGLSLACIIISMIYFRKIEKVLNFRPFYLLILSAIFYRWWINGSSIRPYGLLIATLASSTYYLIQSFTSSPRKNLILYTILMTCAWYTHYTGVLIIFCHFALIFEHFKHRSQDAANYIRRYSIYLAIFGILFIPGYAHIFLWKDKIESSFAYAPNYKLLCHLFEITISSLALVVCYHDWKKIRITYSYLIGFAFPILALLLIYLLTGSANFTADRYLIGAGFSLLFFIATSFKELRLFPYMQAVILILVLAPARYDKMLIFMDEAIAKQLPLGDLSKDERWSELGKYVKQNLNQKFNHIVYVSPFIEAHSVKFLSNPDNFDFLVTPLNYLIPDNLSQTKLINKTQLSELQREMAEGKITEFDKLKPYFLITNGNITLDKEILHFGIIKGTIIDD